jgi:hypothetical protein
MSNGIKHRWPCGIPTTPITTRANTASSYGSSHTDTAQQATRQEFPAQSGNRLEKKPKEGTLDIPNTGGAANSGGSDHG